MTKIPTWVAITMGVFVGHMISSEMQRADVYLGTVMREAVTGDTSDPMTLRYLLTVGSTQKSIPTKVFRLQDICISTGKNMVAQHLNWYPQDKNIFSAHCDKVLTQYP